jgi:hypothetical protein
MGGGLMQLVAYGAQDIYLTGNPQITFFKVVYRRHTNFSMEAIQQTWNGTHTTAGRCTATISRNGDLVSRMYLELKGTTGSGANQSVTGITNISLEIGGQLIDKHSKLWMEVWAELTEPNPSGHTGDTDHATLDGTRFQNMSGMGGAYTGGGQHQVHTVPLYFWFCRNPGLALPLIALQYHEVKVILEHTFGTGGFTTCNENNLWVDYIYLDTDERRRFAQVSHEYLIEQVQEQTLTNVAGSSDLNFNHPVKELIWTRGDSSTTQCQPRVVSSNINATPAKYQLKLNGHDRMAARDYRYFTRTQVWQHHTGAGLTANDISAAQGFTTSFDDTIAVYSFALKPEEHQPSGTCNFSRIDNAQLVATTHGLADTIFAVNYNVLRIMSGMGGLAYSN